MTLTLTRVALELKINQTNQSHVKKSQNPDRRIGFRLHGTGSRVRHNPGSG